MMPEPKCGMTYCQCCRCLTEQAQQDYWTHNRNVFLTPSSILKTAHDIRVVSLVRHKRLSRALVPPQQWLRLKNHVLRRDMTESVNKLTNATEQAASAMRRVVETLSQRL